MSILTDFLNALRFDDEIDMDTAGDLMSDAADVIEQQMAEIEQLKRERDAAVRLLQRECSTCLHWHPKTNKPCRLPKGQCSWLGREGWQWRGMQEGEDGGAGR